MTWKVLPAFGRWAQRAAFASYPNSHAQQGKSVLPPDEAPGGVPRELRVMRK